jgi:hypothetical protein
MNNEYAFILFVCQSLCNYLFIITLFTKLLSQIQLLISKEKPIFSNLVEHNSGLVTVAGCQSPAGNSLSGSQPAGSSLSGSEPKTDMYRPVYDVSRLRSMLTHAVNEYNKTDPIINVALYEVEHCEVNIVRETKMPYF